MNTGQVERRRTFKYFHKKALFDATECKRLQLFFSYALFFLFLFKESHLNENSVGVFVVSGGRVQLVGVLTFSQSEISCWFLLLLCSEPFFSFQIGCSLMQHLEALRVEWEGSDGAFKPNVYTIHCRVLQYLLYVWSRGSERRSSFCLPMSDSIFLFLFFLQEKRL